MGPAVGHLTIPGNTLAKVISFGLRVRFVSWWNGWRMRLDCHITAFFREFSRKRVRVRRCADDHQLGAASPIKILFMRISLAIKLKAFSYSN